MHSDDFLDTLADDVSAQWQELGGSEDRVDIAAERRELQLQADDVAAAGRQRPGD
jgi:hypothetical protein